jgi:hypothetical protein
MGHNSRPIVVLQFLAALEQCLQAQGTQGTQGVKGTLGRAVAAAEQAYTAVS